MATVVIEGVDSLHGLVGQELAVSDWITVTQAMIDEFASATGDRQWIHTDPERAALESPYGGPIAHGLFTLSLGATLLQELLDFRQIRLIVNCGFNRVRFPAPVPAGSRIRLRLKLLELEDLEDGVRVVILQTFDGETRAKPVCVAESVLRLYRGE